MRYQISYLIKDKAKDYHENLSNAIATAYKMRPVTERIDPHLTIKAPFDTDSIFEVEDIIEDFVMRSEKKPLTLKGFGRFEDRIVYMDITAPDDTHTLINRLQDHLLRIPWMSFRSYEIPTVLHATLCYPKTKRQADDIYNRLAGKGGRTFDLMFDNIAILKRGPKRWEVMKEFSID